MIEVKSGLVVARPVGIEPAVAWTLESDRQRAYAAGCDGFLLKPCRRWHSSQKFGAS